MKISRAALIISCARLGDGQICSANIFPLPCFFPCGRENGCASFRVGAGVGAVGSPARAAIGFELCQVGARPQNVLQTFDSVSLRFSLQRGKQVRFVDRWFAATLLRLDLLLGLRLDQRQQLPPRRPAPGNGIERHASGQRADDILRFRKFELLRRPLQRRKQRAPESLPDQLCRPRLAARPACAEASAGQANLPSAEALAQAEFPDWPFLKRICRGRPRPTA
jgi:hypothetical protein